MKLTIGLAKKLLHLSEGKTVPRSQLQGDLVEHLLEDGVLNRRSNGSRQLFYCPNKDYLQHFLSNHLGINDLATFVVAASQPELKRSEAAQISSDSKLKNIRTFKGFLVNCTQPIAATLDAAPFLISPTPGAFTYIYDFERFIPELDCTIVGVENGENFRYLEQQQGLFPSGNLLFVSRYPQSGDLIQWLQSIPNRYLHFGDFDFAGINIYLHEFKKHLGSRAQFFVPDNIESLFASYGNRSLYDRQLSRQPAWDDLPEAALKNLLNLICRQRKGLEQEVLIALQDANQGVL